MSTRKKIGGTRGKVVIIFALAVLLIGGVFSFTLASAKTKLVIAGRDGTYGEAMQLAVDTYVKENPDVQIELLKLPWSGLYEKLIVDMKEAVGAYDIVMVDDTLLTGFASHGWLTNLTQMFRQKTEPLDPDFIDTAVDVGRYPYVPGIGSIYGLPHVGNVELFSYREDLFKKYGLSHPPQTWSQVLEAAKTIHQKESEVAGIVFRGVKGNPIVAGFLPMFWSFGAEMFDKAGNPTVNSEQAVNALKFFLQLKKYAPRGVVSYNASEVKDALLMGTTAMAPEVWPAWVPDLNNPAKSKVAGKVKITTHPGQVTKPAPMIGIWLLSIPQASKNKDEAFQFLQFITSAGLQKKMAIGVGLPPTKESIYQDPQVVEKYGWYPTQLNALRMSRPRPRIPEWLEVEPTFGEYLNLALVGEMSPQEALDEANRKIREIVE